MLDFCRSLIREITISLKKKYNENKFPLEEVSGNSILIVKWTIQDMYLPPFLPHTEESAWPSN